MTWLYGLIGAAFLGLIGIVWKMLNDKIAAIQRECNTRDELIWNQIGRDSQSGMRAIVHAVGHLPEKFMDMDRDIEELRARK